MVSYISEHSSKINPTKSLVSGAGNARKPRLTSQAGIVNGAVFAYNNVFPQSDRWRCQHVFAYVAATIT
jgi:hypothetical protein